MRAAFACAFAVGDLLRIALLAGSAVFSIYMAYGIYALCMCVRVCCGVTESSYIDVILRCTFYITHNTTHTRARAYQYFPHRVTL